VSRQTLTVRQLYALARRAGLPPDRATVAAAVAMAESGGQTWVTSPNPDGGTNVGLWQLDTPGGEGAGYSVEQLADPWTNAKVMAKTTNGGQSWGPWQTYVEGTYDKYLPAALTAQKSEPSSSQAKDSGGSWIDSAIHGIEGIGKVLEGGANSAASAAGSVLSLPSGVTGFFSEADKFAQEALWLLNPANWMRVLSGMIGFVLLAAGIMVLVRAA
jgi:hypothetical protein